MSLNKICKKQDLFKIAESIYSVLRMCDISSWIFYLNVTHDPIMHFKLHS